MRSSSISNSDSQKSHNLKSRSRTKSPPSKPLPANPSLQSSSLRLKVEGICKDASENHLSEIFSTFGLVTSCSFPKDDNKHRSRRSAFVEYSNINEAEIALKLMDGAEINGRLLTVSFSEKEPETDRERSREKEKERKLAEEPKKAEDPKDKKPPRREAAKEEPKNAPEAKPKETSRPQRPTAGRYTKHEKREEDSSDSRPRKARDSSRGSSRSSSSSLSTSSENSSG